MTHAQIILLLSVFLVLLGFGGLWMNVPHSGWILGVGLFAAMVGLDKD